VPGAGQIPQTFETIAEIEARPGWNRLPAQQGSPWTPRMDETEAYLDGVTTGLKPGDAILFVGKERDEDPGSERWDVRLLSTVDPDPDRAVTRITWDHGLGWRLPSGQRVKPAEQDVRCYAFRLRASLFGYNAPDWRSMPQEICDAFLSVAGVPDPGDWPTLAISTVGATPSDPNPAMTVFLDAVYPKIVPGSWLALRAPLSATEPPYVELFRATEVRESSRADFTIAAKTTEVTLEGENLRLYEHQIRSTVVFAQSEELAFAEAPVSDPVQGSTITLDTTVDGLEKGRLLVVTGKRPTVAVADGVHLSLVAATGSIDLAPRTVLQVIQAFAENADGTRTWTVQTDDGTQGAVTATPHDLAPVAATSDEVLAEAASLVSASPLPGDPGRTILTLAAPLSGTYDRGSTAVAANAAPATHGETKTEVLGSGSAAVPFQSFTLKGSPLTFVSSTDPSGGTTTLTVSVGGVAWTEAPALYRLGPRDRAYVSRIAEDGSVTVEFGDGSEGARLPTGQENVRAGYRVGTGVAGNLDVDRLSLLMTRPLGVTKVSNPLPATGGADPESLADARRNAPRTALTFDRVVSVQDYEDYSRAFAGIAKAQARWLWDGSNRVVFVTVAGIEGADVAEGSATFTNLVTSIREHGDPRQPFVVASYEALTFDLEAGIFLEAGYDADAVRAGVAGALRKSFSFDRRELAQPVTGSEVISAMQAIPGVLAVDLDALAFTGQSPPAEPALPARAARHDHAHLRPAQLLTINPAEAALSIELRP
jgi:Baseplate J-like protein